MKRFGVIFIFLLTLAEFAFAPKALALAPSTDAKTFGDAVDKCSFGVDCSNQQWYTTNQIHSTAWIFIGDTVGLPTTNPNGVFGYNKSAVTGMTNVMLAMYTNPPLDFMAWVHSTAQALGFEPKPAYAQGIGFSGLSIILPIWQAFRNVSYAILAIIMVVIGFMVMFRQKIDPKTVVTVQNALPKIIFALLLITFSYAIAAFMIDLMYLTMAVVINLLVSSSPKILGPDTASKYLSGNIGTLFNALFGGGISAITDTFRFIFFTSTNGAPWYAQAAIAIATAPILGAGLVIISLIVAIALLFGIIRIIFMLISAYIQIIVSVLIAPFQLMTEALPGSTGFSSWLKNLVANLSVFPITAAMLLVGTILTHSNGGNAILGNASSTGTIWAPPLLAGGGVNVGITGIIGLGVLLTIPNIANSVKEALKAKAPVNAGLGAILGPVGGGIGQIFQYGYQASFITSAFRHGTGKEEKTDLQTGMGAHTKPLSPVTGGG